MATRGSSNNPPKFSRKDAGERRQQLVDAAIDCLADGGMAGFTIDRICKKAGISRGLISHHFDGKDDLLVHAYEAMTHHLIETAHATHRVVQDDPAAALNAVIEMNFAEDVLDRSKLTAWLAVWGEVTRNPSLRQIHRQRYPAYRDAIASAISELARIRGHQLDAPALATSLVALIDGLWIEWCLDPTLLSAADAKRACYDLLEAKLGPIDRAS